MNTFFKTSFILLAFFAGGTIAHAQLPNEKFGKPSYQEWDYLSDSNEANADAVVLCKTMTVSYRLSDQMFTNNMSDSELSTSDLMDYGKNNIDDANIIVDHKFALRTKILKPEGVQHANIDITYFDANNKIVIHSDDVQDFKIKVFSKNAKGKVEKRTVNTKDFVRERVDDNYMVIHVVVPDVKAGDIIEYQYNIVSTRPVFLYDWTFQEDIPVVRSKCDIEIPAFLKFNMNVPINSKKIASEVKAGRLTYDMNRPDMKKGKSIVTNHYKIIGDNILPQDEQLAPFTSSIVSPNATLPAYLPEGSTHLKIK